MLETLVFPTDKRKSACGFTVGDRVRTNIGNDVGTIIGFGPAMHNGCTVKIKLDEKPGNMGDHHSCGNLWITPI